MMFARNKHLDNLVAANHIPSSPTLNGDLSGFLSPRSNRRLMPSSKSTQPLLQLGTTATNGLQNGTANGHLMQNGNRSPGPFPAAPPALHPPGSPKQTNKNGNSLQPQPQERNASSNGGGFFKSLVNVSRFGFLCSFLIVLQFCIEFQNVRI